MKTDFPASVYLEYASKTPPIIYFRENVLSFSKVLSLVPFETSTQDGMPHYLISRTSENAELDTFKFNICEYSLVKGNSTTLSTITSPAFDE